jgi:hypothetical protein
MEVPPSLVGGRIDRMRLECARESREGRLECIQTNQKRKENDMEGN